jgi:hypothetical protein
MKCTPKAITTFMIFFISKGVLAQPKIPEIRAPIQIPDITQATKIRSPLLPKWNLDAIDRSRYAIDRSRDVRSTIGLDEPPKLPEGYRTSYYYDRPREGRPLDNPYFPGKTINRTAPERLYQASNFSAPANDKNMPLLEVIRPPVAIEAFFLNYHLGLTPNLSSDLPLMRFAEKGKGEIIDLLQVKNIFNLPLSVTSSQLDYEPYSKERVRFFSNDANFDKVNYINSAFGDPFRWNDQFYVNDSIRGTTINNETFPR